MRSFANKQSDGHNKHATDLGAVTLFFTQLFDIQYTCVKLMS